MRWGPLFLAMQNQLVTTVTVTLQLTQNMGSSDGRSSIIPDNDSKKRIFTQQLEMPEARTLSWLQIYYEFAD